MTSSVELGGVQGTMLWVLYNRANEARRLDTYLHDPDCLRVYESIDYDFERSFGKPHSGHPMPSKLLDDALRLLARNASGRHGHRTRSRARDPIPAL